MNKPWATLVPPLSSVFTASSFGIITNTTADAVIPPKI
jgi:hypothetical protein